MRIIEAQEEERRRLAREIHDGPAQTLSNVVLRAEICEKLLAGKREELGPELIKLKKAARETLQEIRRIIFDLRPVSVEDLGLVMSLRRYLDDFKKKTDIRGEVAVSGKEERLPSFIEVAVFRIVQESLNNVSKHSWARNVSIKVDYSPSTLTVSIEDDGRGFDLDEALRVSTGRDGFGLSSMRERAGLVNAEFKVETAPGRGTKVSLVVPLEGWFGAEG